LVWRYELDFYTSVFQRGDKIYVRGFKNGKRSKFIENYHPYMFIQKQGGKYRTLDNKPVEKMQFDSISDAKDFIGRYEDVSNMEIYGLNAFTYVYIFDAFKGEINYDPKTIRIGNIDIEVAADEGFPNIQKADKEITAIALRFQGTNYVFGCGHFISNDPNTSYLRCKNEYDLLAKFLLAWQHLDMDIVTGWNVEFFDMPYLVNRIKSLLGMSEAKKLSPWGILNERMVEFKGKENQSYEPVGITVLDYYQLYRKFTFGNQESYKLDYISQIELGEKKVDYSEYGNLLELYKKDYQKFIEYNIQDVVLVEKLDDKLKFLEQVMALAYDAKVNYSDTMTTVRSWDVIIHNYLLEQNIVIPQFKKQPDNEALVGGHVKEPKIGLSKWVVSFDLNSLYPHLIMQYNISPETFVGKLDDMPSIDDLLDLKYPFGSPYRSAAGVAYAANGCYYTREKQGFLPALMEKMYNSRSEYKKLMIEAKKRYEETKNPEDAKLVARYHNMQLAKKIQLNSAYGALGNQYFRWFNHNHAEAITMSGQLSIRWIEKKMNQFMNKVLNTTDIDYVIASDTDSIYVTMEELVKHLKIDDDHFIVGAIDAFCELKIQPYMDQCYQELADMMNAYQQKMKMKRETIANKGIWRGKKMYILNAWNVEGVQYDKPKLKLSGIEAVRSSTPHACRENIKKAFGIIMNGDQNELIQFIEEFKAKFMTLPFEDVAFPRGVKGLDADPKGYADAATIYVKGTPIHVKGALLFNHLLKEKNINHIPPIQNGDKIRFAYLKFPNPINDTVIATPDEMPDELGLDKYIDRELQFNKSFLEPVKSITSVIGWNAEHISTLEDFFS
jgi:DNA polymerase elongation subunit (family B)